MSKRMPGKNKKMNLSVYPSTFALSKEAAPMSIQVNNNSTRARHLSFSPRFSVNTNRIHALRTETRMNCHQNDTRVPYQQQQEEQGNDSPTTNIVSTRVSRRSHCLFPLARIVLQAEPPHAVVHANAAYARMMWQRKSSSRKQQHHRLPSFFTHECLSKCLSRE